MTAIINTLKLSQLHIDKMNVRGPTQAEPDFVANIGERGVEQKLIVRKNGSGYGVVDGGKRLSALQALLASGKVAADAAVPVDVRELTDQQARELSLTLNIVRRSMHPVDEFRAVAELVGAGKQALDVEAIATRFAMKRKDVEQMLALGNLADEILDAWKAGNVDTDVARYLTMCPSKKAQVEVFNKVTHKGKEKAIGYSGLDAVKRALKIGYNNPGRALAIVDAAEYAKRGGKITRDLFGTDHKVSDVKLLEAMVQEKIADTAKALLDAGWSWVETEWPHDFYSHGRLQAKAADKELAARFKKLDDQLGELDDDESPEYQQIENERDALGEQMKRDAYTAEQMKRGGCIVTLNDRKDALRIEFGLIKPAERKSSERATASVAKAKATKAKRKGDNRISNALVQRLSEQMTDAANSAMRSQPAELVLAALLAGFASHDDTVSVRETGLRTLESRSFGGGAAFAPTFEQLRKKSLKDLLGAVAAVAGQAINLRTFNSERPPMKDNAVAALVNALDGKTMNTKLREQFDAKDYFESVARTVIVDVVTEAMGGEHGRKVAAMKKPEAAKFAIANVPQTGWLPSQMRTAHYDGPRGKTAKPAAKAKAKAVKTAKAAKAKANKKSKR